jgi:mycothiol synthase
VPRLEVKRHMAPADIAVVTELLDAAVRADGHPALADHQWLDLVQGGRSGFAGLVAWEEGHQHPIAYAQVSRGNDSWGLELVVHPHHRYDMAGIGPAMLDAALDVVAAEGGGHVHWWVFEPTTIHLDLAEHAGLRPGRRLLQMRRSLPVGIPFDVATRTFRVGADEEAWLEVNNAAFAWHPEQGGWTLDTIRGRESEPWFDPEGFLVHERDGRMAAFCWTKVHDDVVPPLGEIYVIAVHPDFHGHGLGRALTLAGLQSLAERGLEVGMLYVDEDNHSAVGLYRALGFTIHHVDRAFVGDIAPRRSADGLSHQMADHARHEHGEAAEHHQP